MLIKHITEFDRTDQSEGAVTDHALDDSRFLSLGQWFDGVKQEHGEDLRAEPLLRGAPDLRRLR